jgi:DNA-binding IclR family transcriptional regulator
MANADLVRQDEVNRRYSPSNGIYGFWPNDIRTVCRPRMEALERDVRETICLLVPRGKDRVCIEVVQTDRELRIAAVNGRRLPVYAGASGKIFLSFMPEDELTRRFEDIELKNFTPNSVVSKKAYMEDLKRVRAQGYAFTVSEVTQDCSTTSAPIIDDMGRVIAAIAIRSPATRITKENVGPIAERLLKTVADISKDLGYGESLSKASA